MASCGALTLAAGLLAVAPVQAQAHDRHQPNTDSRWERLAANEPAPPFSLTDQDGRRASLAQMRGKAVVLTFLFTHCVEACPLLPEILGQALAHLTPTQRAAVNLVGITLDPRRDHPARLKAFMQARGLDPARWTLLTGSVAELSQVVADYGVVARSDPRLEIIHNTVFVLIDPNGRLRVEYHGLASPPAEIAKSLRALTATRGG